jgi:hypothetical protein
LAPVSRSRVERYAVNGRLHIAALGRLHRPAELTERGGHYQVTVWRQTADAVLPEVICETTRDCRDDVPIEVRRNGGDLDIRYRIAVSVSNLASDDRGRSHVEKQIL